MNKMRLRFKRLFKEDNRGVALILSIIVVSVLFIFTSFLVRRVVTNTLTVGKMRDEQTGYALAKKGILYAVDRLNNPPNDGTGWPEDENWQEYDVDTEHSGNDVSIKVDKNNPSGYVTIQSQDLPKKLVTFEGIADSKSPLLRYVRFINADTTFGNNTFGDSGMIRGESPFCILGDLTWGNGSSNNLTLTGDNIVAIYGKITAFDEASTTLEIKDHLLATGHHYYTDPSDPSDPTLFDTAGGHYFDLDHLPSSYDYSSGSPDFHYGTSRALLWPHINEERYGNLHNISVSISQSECGNRGTGWDDWYPSSFPPSSGTYWRQDGSTSTSYTYTPPGVHIVLTDQDLDNADGDNDPATGDKEMILITDNSINDDPAEYDSSSSLSFIAYPDSPIIYGPGDIRIEGIIPAGVQMTVVSGGNIYIEGNIYQGDSTSSLALLTKKNVLLNTTHRWVVNSPTANTSITKDEWEYGSHLEGYIDTTQKMSVSVTTSDPTPTKTQIIDFGGRETNTACHQTICARKIILKGCEWTVNSGTIELKVEVSRDGINWVPMTDETGTTPVRLFSTPTSGTGDIQAYIPSTFSYARVFRYIRLILERDGTGEGNMKIDSLEVVLEGIQGGVAIFSEEAEWSIIPGNVLGLPLTFNIALSEKNLEDKSKWDSKWPDITYTYDSNLPNNSPPELPSSVNLVSLSRK